MGTIADKLALLQTTKADIRQAIIDKGQEVPATAPFSGYPDKIRAIQSGADTSDATATAGDILSGKTAYVKGAKITGNITTRSASSLTASGATVTVPAGYYPSQASKSVATATHPKPTISRSGGVITASHAQSAGYTSGGTTTETLTLPTQAAATITPTKNGVIAVNEGVLTTGIVRVAGDISLTPEAIRKGWSIFGVEGAFESLQDFSVTITGYVDTAQETSHSIVYYNANGNYTTASVKSGPNPSSTTIRVYAGFPVLVRAEKFAFANNSALLPTNLATPISGTRCVIITGNNAEFMVG